MSFFNLPRFQIGERDWGQKLLDWFDEAERTLGVNSNLILQADVSYGLGAPGAMVNIASATTLSKANPSAGRWGRLVLQGPMADSQDTLARLLGTSRVAGVVGAGFGETLYHDADSDQFTNVPSDAVVLASSGAIQFLPLGYAFAGGSEAFVNGLVPIQICPVIGSGAGISYKPGVNDPTGDWTVVFDSGPVQKITFDAINQSIDLLFPFVVPGDFLEWLDKTDSDSWWAFLAKFKTTGTATLSVYSVIDTAGNEFVISGTGATSVGSFGTLVARQKTIRDLGGTWTPSNIAYLRLRASNAAGATDAVSVRPQTSIQYFPAFDWQV